ncbi:LemA family protein [Streptococcus himalayensis]|uniref:LemA family protein n=1 Tax=Streptococcus himalayensis TaxID=1888195 RepID=A0A917AAR6_9STRE|nr:LemA family protein [Streptococcus himalayensis]GGE37188.1 LemA family protein [Streptococcus himalayensis]
MKKRNPFVILLSFLGIFILAAFVWMLIFSTFTPAGFPEDQTWEPFPFAIPSLAMLTTIILIVSLQYNHLRFLEQRLENSKSNITIYEERNKQLLDKANRFVDKHQDREKETIVDVAKVSGKEYQKEVKHHLKGSTIESSAEFGQFLEEMPDLLANKNVERLLQEIFNTENNLAQFRFTYNQDVENFNVQLHEFPTNLVAKLCKIKPKDYYVLSVDEEFTDDMLGI